jgi:formylglycine-generating enzyme required for sulfatase activity
MKTLGWLVIPGLAACLAGAAEPQLKIDLGGGLGLELVLVRAGEFTQGSPETEPGRSADETQRPVRITRDYYIGRTAVTRGQWERFVAETRYRSEAEIGTSGGFGWDGTALVQNKSFTWRSPGFPQTNDHPVCMVTFPDAEEFCRWLERKTRRKTTLPTEAQWEFACRAGTDTPWHTGSTPADGDRAAWHKGNSGNGTRPADSTTPNPWGLIIGGNVAEWCLDWYAPYQSGPAVDPRQDNPNLSDKPRRVLRGGSWNRDAKNTRSAARFRVDPRSRNADIGFRIVCSAEVPATPPPRPAQAPVPPKVEAEPGDPPAPAQIPHRDPPREMPHRTVSRWPSIFSGLGGLLCMLIPIGLIILFIRLIAAHGKQANNPFVVQTPPPVVRPPVRKVDDGFWIHGDWPVGTALKLRYVIAGDPTVLDLIYRPGPEGQFIFTGTRPDSVSVVEDGDDPVPPALFATPPVLPERTEETAPAIPRPPLFPAAY